MAPELISAFIWAWAGVAVPGDAVPATSPAETRAAACPDFAALGKRVDARAEAVRPGVSLREFTRNGIAQSLNFWDPVPGGLRETVFDVYVVEGNAVVSDNLVCRFKGDTLVSCTRECCRVTSRTIQPEQYEALRVGESREEVERRLCSPSDVETKGADEVHLFYHVPLPVGHHDEGQTALLVFKAGRLHSKAMSPYF